ncbi:unnamed protein product [Kuraishia capsulata CBS 1993]|uniref:Actin cytoskeleton-regulatory complex protein PAN1 n=1 Tax=Kuraishia capsulata CBS 1993 TaxID=1382522 RepID=W6MJV0_9ASCO|nr:uncharacterized protein KUCA_T00002788001 [Kuraishia capsulata CBS 1993]CDK26814.1 unnamed protein product [Kuraishia capsulata CBS 1993]
MYNPYQGFNQYNGYQQPQQQSGYGYQQPGFQPQQTGFQPQQTGFQPQQTGFQPQPQQTGFQPQQAGFQSQQAGFQSTGIQAENRDLKIPSIRLTFISAQDQENFEHLFRASVPKGENSIDGNAARDILLKSNLSPLQLAEIWQLADTTKSGKLLFPEFALALHLCNGAIKGEPIPYDLPLKIRNEVSSFVDVISFNVDDSKDSIPQNTPFTEAIKAQQTGFGNGFQQPQQTGYGFNQNGGGVVPQQTGYQPQTSFQNGIGSQQTGYQPQQTGYQPLGQQKTGGLPIQATGFNQGAGFGSQVSGLVSQQNGFNAPAAGNQTGLAPQQTGYQPLAQQKTGTFQPLTQQKTGTFQPLLPQQTAGLVPLGAQRTGGLVPQQTGLLPQQTGYQPLQPQATGLMPQPTGLTAMPTGRPGQWGFVSMPTGGLPGLEMMQSHFLPGSSSQTSQLNSAMNGGFQTQDVPWAITKNEKMIYDNIFKQWDKERKGFIDGPSAISIFGKSGLARPDLEKIWTLADLSNRGKLNKDEFSVAMHLVYRRLNGLDIPNFLPPELIPPSSKMLKETMNNIKGKLFNDSISNKPRQSASGRTDGTRFKNDDEDIGYVSSSRYGRGKKETKSDSSNAKLSVEELKKLVHERQIILDAIDAKDQDSTAAFTEQKSLNEIELLKTKIKTAQSSINSAGEATNLEQRQALGKKLDEILDKVPQLVSLIEKVDSEIKDAKIQLYRVQISKENPSGIEITGTGPNGTVTDGDRRLAKSRATLQARMAALTGKPAPNLAAWEDNETKLTQEIEKLTLETVREQKEVKEIGASIGELAKGASSSLRLTNSSSVGFEKWEKGDGVTSSEVKEFIRLLNDSKPAPQPKKESAVIPQPAVAASFSPSVPDSTSRQSQSPAVSSTSSTPSLAYSAFKSAEDRAKHIKEQAEKRMNERLAKLGISRRGAQKAEAAPDSPPPPAVVARSDVTSPRAPPVPPVSRHSTATHKQPVKEVEKEKEEESSGDDDDDEEERELQRLVEEKKALENKEKERKLKKKQEREARLAKLKQEMEDLKKKEEADDSSDDEFEDAKQSQTPVAATPTILEPKKEVIQDHNPFAKLAAQQQTGKSNNPFFKPQVPTEEKFDAKAAEAQRNAQRGVTANGDDDDWSNSDVASDDDDDLGVSRGSGPAHLANLLFKGMGAGSNSESSTPPPVPVTAAAPVAPVAPAVPAAPPVPTQEPEVVKEAEVSSEEPEEHNESVSIPPIPTAPALPTNSAPPPPPIPNMGAPPPPPLPSVGAPPPPPPPSMPSNGSAPGGGAPDIGALLGQINMGKSLRKVNDEEKHIVESGVTGKVL